MGKVLVQGQGPFCIFVQDGPIKCDALGEIHLLAINGSELELVKIRVRL